LARWGIPVGHPGDPGWKRSREIPPSQIEVAKLGMTDQFRRQGTRNAAAAEIQGSQAGQSEEVAQRRGSHVRVREDEFLEHLQLVEFGGRCRHLGVIAEIEHLEHLHAP